MEGDRQQLIPLLVAPVHRDPYSLQLSFLFPDWPARYRHGEFRKLVERTIREETPAHLIPTIRWLDQMRGATPASNL